MDSQELAQDYADTIAEELLQVEDGRDEDGAQVDPVDAAAFWFADLLEVETVRDSRGDLRRVECLRTTGGPGCLVTFDGSGSALVEAWTGSGRASRRVETPTLEAYAWDLADALRAA